MYIMMSGSDQINALSLLDGDGGSGSPNSQDI